MNIDILSISVGEPPQAPHAAPTGNGGATFGRFLDNAEANASGKAASDARQDATSRQAASNRRTASAPNATPPRENDGRRTSKPATSAAPTNATAPTPAPERAQAASPDQPASAQAAKPASPGDVSLPLADGHGDGGRGARDDKSADSGDQAGNDVASQNAAALIPAIPVALVPLIAPVMGSVAPALAGSANAEPSPAGMLQQAAAAAAADSSALVGTGTAPAAAPSLASAANDAANALGNVPGIGPSLAPAANATGNAAGNAEGGAAALPANAFQGLLTSGAADIAAPAAPLAPVAGTNSSGTSVQPAPLNNRNPTGTVSAQAAALLARLSGPGAAPSMTASPPAGSAGAQVAGAAANGVAAATVTSPSASDALPSATPTPTASANAASAAPATPLPPVSGAIDLSPKLSAVAIPAHGDAAPPAAKAKSAVEAPSPRIATATPVSPSGESAAATTKATADASLAAAGTSEPGLPREDDATAPHAANVSATAPQPRGETIGLVNGAPAASAAPETKAAPLAALHSVVDQVAISLKRGVKGGNDQIQINLEPASLGKIAVRLDFAQDGRVSATFSADRPDTLNLLNNDSRSLEQALRDAGLRADSGSLTFNLSGGDNGASARQFAQSASYAATAATMSDDDPLAALASAQATSRGLSHDGSLDIHV
jgi:flagellar hook-length control protein FliK